MTEVNQLNPEDLSVDEINEILDSDEYTLDTLTLIVLTDRLKQLENQTMNEIQDLKKRQEQVRFLHKLLQKINAATNDKGEINLEDNPELQEMLDKAEEMGIEFTIKNGKFNTDQRDYLVENIRMKIDDFNVQNDMQLQTISRLTNERYEMYQMARSILKPLHEDRIQKARAMAGRGG
jgi:K+ transporter